MRLFVIFAAVWRFGLDDIALAASSHWAARGWRRVTGWRHARPRAERLRLALQALGPIFIKFGQILSTRRDILPADYADELAKLQDRVPPEPPAAIAATLRHAYGRPATEVFSQFDAVPVGSASVAQVHRAVLADSGATVAVKILRPRVRRRIARDLALLNAFAAIAEKILRDGRRLKPRAIVAQFARHLNAETNLMREAANCAQLKKNSAEQPHLRVPAVHWRHCRQSVMVMEFLPGIPISRADELGAAINKSALARAGIDLFFTQVFRDNFFHADMHPGNVHIDAGGRFVLLDYGIVGQLTDFDRDYLLRNFLAFFNRDYRGVAAMHVAAGWVPADVDIQEFESELRAVCEPIFSQPLRNISFGDFLLKMFQTARRFKLEVQPQLLLLQKTLLNVEGMGRELDPDINMWDTAKPVLERWARAQRHPRHTLALLRQQAPDWRALLASAPAALRDMLAQRESSESAAALRRERRRASWWRAMALAAVFALGGVAGAAAFAAFLLHT